MSVRDVVWRNVTIAAVYFILGRCALLMAIPPGYASAIWPAAGLALLGVLVWGPRVSPGILLGSVAVNIETSWNSDTWDTMLESIALLLSIGTGAVMQALLGSCSSDASLVFRRLSSKSATCSCSCCSGHPSPAF